LSNSKTILVKQVLFEVTCLIYPTFHTMSIMTLI